MNDLDEEIDVPNSPLDEYMSQFKVNININLADELENKSPKMSSSSNNTNQSPKASLAVTTSEQVKQTFDVESLKMWSKKVAEYLVYRLVYNENYLRTLLNETSVEDNERNNTFLEMLTEKDQNCLTKAFSLQSTKLNFKFTPDVELKSCVVFIVLIKLIVLFLYLFGFTKLLVLFIVLIVFASLHKFLFKVLFDRLLSEILGNMSRTKSLCVYMMQTQNLSTNMKQLLSGKDLNSEYRKLFFSYLREEYFRLKMINLSLADTFGDINVELSCRIEQDELNAILKDGPLNDEQLKEYTKNYNLNVLSSLNYANAIQISELATLALLNYLKVDIGAFYLLVAKVIYWITIFRGNNQSIDSLIEICKLKVEPGSKGAAEMKSSKNQVAVANDVENMQQKSTISLLSLHLRNALLNTYKAQEDGGIGILGVIENDIELSMMFVKKYRLEMLSESGQEELKKKFELDGGKMEEKPQETETPKRLSDNAKLPIEDYDMFLISTESIEDMKKKSRNSKEVESNEDNLVEVRSTIENIEMKLLASNLYDELKEKLVDKQAEWSEREKNAKIVVDGNLVEYEKKMSDKSNSSDIENDLLKYKSELRNRKRSSQSKYQYIPDENENEVVTSDVATDGHAGMTTVEENANEHKVTDTDVVSESEKSNESAAEHESVHENEVEHENEHKTGDESEHEAGHDGEHETGNESVHETEHEAGYETENEVVAETERPKRSNDSGDKRPNNAFLSELMAKKNEMYNDSEKDTEDVYE